MIETRSEQSRRIAVVGSGVAGLACAHLLDGLHRVTLFEADVRPGGHANTVTVEDPDAGPLAIDTGFIVHNDRNYPNLIRLFNELGVATKPSEMSFGVADASSDFAYRATSLATLLARPSNAVDPRLWRMLIDIVRFFRHGRRFLADPDPEMTIGAFLEQGRYSTTFLRLHLLPMGAAVWSTGPDDFTRFPAASLLRFLDNHGLLGVGDRPHWRTVVGGSITYVQAILDRFGGKLRLGCPVAEVSRSEGDGRPTVTVTTAAGREEFDTVILACHSNQARKLLTDRSAIEDHVLGGVTYLDNVAVLHTDTSFLPRHRRAWSAWNYLAGPDLDRPTVTYDLTTLQRLEGRHRYLVTLNPERPPSGELARFVYAHPQFDLAAIEAQRRFDEIDGNGGVHYCGAWWGYGFHEDGVESAVRVCRKLGATW